MRMFIGISTLNKMLGEAERDVIITTYKLIFGHCF
jgi:hypothetical protein